MLIDPHSFGDIVTIQVYSNTTLVLFVWTLRFLCTLCSMLESGCYTTPQIIKTKNQVNLIFILSLTGWLAVAGNSRKLLCWKLISQNRNCGQDFVTKCLLHSSLGVGPSSYQTMYTHVSLGPLSTYLCILVHLLYSAIYKGLYISEPLYPCLYSISLITLHIRELLL